jgi:hypothetical protein
MMLWKPGTPGGVSVVGETPDNKSGSLTLVRSGRLPAAMLIETGNPSVPVIHSTPSAVVQTSRDTPILLEIGDGELFTLLAGRPAALVRLQSGQAELLLLDGADQALLQSHHQLLPRGILNYPR